MLDRLKKLINGEIAFGFFLATIFWIAVLGWVTSFQSTPQEQEACYQSAAKSGRDTSECKTFWEKTTSEPVAFFSLVLAFSTVGMWLATIGLYRSAEKQIRTSRQIAKDQAQQTRISNAQAIRAANAADQSAQAAVAAERARFYILVFRHNLNDVLATIGRYPNSPTMPLSFEPKIEYVFKNYGKTPGIISELSHGLTVHPGPPDPVYMVSSHTFMDNMIAAGEATHPARQSRRIRDAAHAGVAVVRVMRRLSERLIRAPSPGGGESRTAGARR